MHADVEEPGRTIVPTLRYRDVAAAIDWLCRAFGFERHLVVPDDNGAVRYAELTFGDGMIMLGPVEDSAFDKLMTQPEDAGGAETQICYLFVEDAGAHCDRAKAAGAEIVLDIEEEDGGGRGYSCRDLEGHIWNFGTYNPWVTLRPSAPGASNRRTLLLSSLLLLGPVALGLMFGAPDQGFAEKDGAAFSWTVQKDAAASESDREARSELAKMRAAKEASERALRSLEEQLAFERDQHVLAGRSLQEAQEQLAKERTVVASINSSDRPANDELERERAARQAAERAVRDVREQLQQARNANQSSERALIEARAELAKANAERDAAEQQTPERVSKALRAHLAKREASKPSLQARMARYRAARLAARARVRRLREAREPHIKPPLPYF